MTNKELAAKIKSMDCWDGDLLRDLCERADMLEEWEAADGDTFEDVAYKAAEKLGVDIG